VSYYPKITPIKPFYEFGEGIGDQKRKLKKRKQKQRKGQQGQSKWAHLSTKILQPGDEEYIQAVVQADFDEQEQRILQVFDAEEIPPVEVDTLGTYFDYIKENLEVPCLLTGIESMGYFGWEERYDFGYGNKAEFERLRRERGSYHDQYELETFEDTLDIDWDILVNVKRTSDGKRFTIPLSELEAVDKTSENSQLLNDYTVWFVNWQ